MSEKKLDEILDLIKVVNAKQDKMEQMRLEDNKRNEERFNTIDKRLEHMEQMRLEDNKRNEERFNKIDKRLEHMEQMRLEDNKRNEERFNKIDKRLEHMEQMRLEDNKKNEERFNKIEKTLKQIEQKRIDDNFYFEHAYWEKISIIFDKLQLNDELKNIENKDKLRLQKQVDSNSAQILLHDSRILKLEQSTKF